MDFLLAAVNLWLCPFISTRDLSNRHLSVVVFLAWDHGKLFYRSILEVENSLKIVGICGLQADRIRARESNPLTKQRPFHPFLPRLAEQLILLLGFLNTGLDGG